MTCALWRVAAIAATFGIGGADLQAAIITRDLRVIGDGLLTYDTVNGREWLDLYETTAFTVDQVDMQLSPGGPLDGFQLASFDDVESLAISAGFDSFPMLGQRGFDTALALIIPLSGHYTGNESTFAWSTGGLVSDNIGPDYFHVEMLALPAPDPLAPRPVYYRGFGGVLSGATRRFSQFSGYPPVPWGGFWLYRDVVPEPFTITILAILMSAAFFRPQVLHRRRNNVST